MPGPARRITVAMVVAGLVGAACAGGSSSDDGDDRRAARRGSTSTSTSTTTSAPATTTTTTAGAAAADPAGCPPVPARAQPDPNRPRYTLRVDVRPAERAASGDLAVRFVPDVPTDRLVFRLWPNGPRPAQGGARLDTGPVTVGGQPAAVERPDPTTLVVPLGRTVAAGEAVEAAMPWALRLPGAIDDRVASGGDWARLGSFFPILPWEPGVGWALQPATSAFAEASSAPTADFDVTVTVPPGLDVLTSGQAQPGAPGRFRAEAVRDFALSVGRFTTVRVVANAPGPVEMVVGVEASLTRTESPERYMARAVRIMQGFAGQFGPYPWPTWTLAITPELGGGIEYPAHVMQGPGTLSRTTSHEIGHMWFYGLVGNDQGRDPWLDEGLASYAEARWEGTLGPEFVRKPIPAAARGQAGQPMTFWESRQAAYYRGVYVQPVAALAALGDVDLIDCALRVYVARNAYRIVRPADLFAALAPVFPRAEEVLAPYGLRP